MALERPIELRGLPRLLQMIVMLQFYSGTFSLYRNILFSNALLALGFLFPFSLKQTTVPALYNNVSSVVESVLHNPKAHYGQGKKYLAHHF